MDMGAGRRSSQPAVVPGADGLFERPLTGCLGHAPDHHSRGVLYRADLDGVGVRGAAQDEPTLVQVARLHRKRQLDHPDHASVRALTGCAAADCAPVQGAAERREAVKAVAGFTIEFTPWGPFHAQKRPEEIRRWLRAVADASEQALKSGMGQYPPASAPGAWPNSRTGNLKGSISSYATDTEAVVGSNMRYSIYLRMGTSKMARRKMSDNALQEGMQKARLGRWVAWVKG